MTVDHYQVGGLSELGSGRARPFLTGLLGLTRYEASGDHEVRILGVRGRRGQTVPGAARRPAPGRTRVRYARGRRCGCAVVHPGICVGSIDAWLVWQAEFTAGVVVRF